MASWRDAIEGTLQDTVRAEAPLSGGSIATARRVTLASGRVIVVKTLDGHPGMFEIEAAGLRELALAGALPIPEVLAAGDGFIALSYIEPGVPEPDFWETFGRGFATLHLRRSDHFGFVRDGYIGATPQPNTMRPATSGWAAWYWEHRLLFQLRLAESRERTTPELIGGMGLLEGRLAELLSGSDEAPSLLHGDLWSGNYLVTASGDAALIDPAVYYGHREADLAMTTLFGGFEPAFYAAYQETAPLADGWERREPVYQLYHLLNHLNLFGSGYLGQCMSALRASLR